MVGKTEEEELDFLMTSDFHEDYSPKDLREFIFRWRYYYRVLYSKNRLGNVEFESLKSKMEKVINEKEYIISNLEKELRETDKKLKSVLNRKLTFKERFFGKIINKK